MRASVLISPFSKQTWGHLMRCFALGEALGALGHHVRFAGPPEARPRVEAAGFELVPLAAMARQELLRPPRSAREAAEARRWIAGELDAARACFDAIAPDVVVTDLQPVVAVAAALAAIPSASVLNLELLASPLAWWLPAIDRLLAEVDVPRWAARRVFGDTLIVADAASVLGLRDLAPDHAARIASSVRELRFVGPMLGELPRRSRDRRARRARSEVPRVPEVIISLGGGLGARLADIVAGCAAAGADLVVVAPRPPDDLARAADEARRSGHRVTVVDFLPDFAHRIAAADALVTHGGHGTLSLAVALGVPTLVVPTSAEQEINARRLHGIGAVAPSDPRAIRAGVSELLSSLLREHGNSLSRSRARRAQSIAMYDGARDAALAVQRLARCPPVEGSW